MLQIPKQILTKMIDHVTSDTSIEMCGYLGAKGQQIATVYPMTNIDRSIEHFSLDPKEQFEVIRTMRGRGEEAVAVFHSHPQTPARPSKEDIRLAYDPVISYVIISLAADTPVTKSFKIKNGTVEPEDIRIIDSEDDNDDSNSKE